METAESVLIPLAPATAVAVEGSPADRLPKAVIKLVPGESRAKRVAFLIIAILITAGFFFFLDSFLAPAPGRPGIDENAYLLGGLNLARHGTTGFKPSDDYQFVGAMWVRTASGWYYPKYPLGTSLLNAAVLLVANRQAAFFIPPVCASLAVLGIFFLARPMVGSFYAVLAMIVLASGPTTLQLADEPNSHAPALCLMVWGIYFLLRWWSAPRWSIGLLAGALLGFAVTCRYTEALLLFPLYPLKVMRFDGYVGPKMLVVFKVLSLLPVGPIGIAALSRVRWKSWRSYFAAGMPVIGWGVPVTALVVFNWFTVGHLTGYDTTNESSGFSIGYFLSKWDFAVYQVYLFGLFIFAPLGVAGLILMVRHGWRTALTLSLWFLPGTLLYMTYYWGGNAPSIAYLRFFLTLFPPLIIASMYLLSQTQQIGVGAVASPLAAGVLTAFAAMVGMGGSIDALTRQHRGNLNLDFSRREIAGQVTRHAKSAASNKPMIMADEGLFPQLLMYMQFMVDADWYATDVFAPRAGGGFGLLGVLEKRKPDDNSPVLLQRERMDYIDSMRKGMIDADYVVKAHQIMDTTLKAGRKIYVILSPTGVSFFRHRFITSDFQMTEMSRWTEPCNITFPDQNQHNWLATQDWTDEALIPWRPHARSMFEITKGPPATRPATEPTTRP